MLHMMLPGLVDFVVSCRPRYAMLNPSLVLSKVGIEELRCKVLWQSLKKLGQYLAEMLPNHSKLIRFKNKKIWDT